MSEQIHIMKIVPPGSEKIWENLEFRNYRCPVCSGEGGFTEETGYNEYKTTECDYCQGVGKVKARVRINWVPDRD